MIEREVAKSKSFIRLVDKSQIPTCNILGVNIAEINMDWLLKYIYENVKSSQGNKLSGDYICVANVHTTVMAYDSLEYSQIQNNALMAIPDGGPLSSLGRKRGCKEMARTTGPDFMSKVFEESVKCGYSHFFFGSTNETLEKMKAELLKTYEGIEISGLYSPPFRPLTSEEEVEIIHRINESKPDFVWVGLGAPKQERWMAQHQGIIDGLMIGVGAGFDYFAGNIKRAPDWMQNCNLEWLYRLLQDPKRLCKRYFYTNTKFLFLLIFT